MTRPNGLAGAVVVHLHPSMHEEVRRGLAVTLAREGLPSLATVVRSAAPVRGGLRVVFEDVRDRNAAEAMVGAAVLVEREALGPMGADEYLDSDIVGLEVVTDDGQPLGRIREVISTGANDVWVVHSPEGREVLVPAVSHAVSTVDLEGGRVTVIADALEYGGASSPRESGRSDRAREEAPAVPASAPGEGCTPAGTKHDVAEAVSARERRPGGKGAVR